MNQVALEEICDIQIGKTPSRSEPSYWGGDLPWATISDISNGRMLTDTKEAITKTGATESGSKLIPSGTLLLSFKLSLGKRAITGRDLFTNEAIAALGIKDPRAADRDYLYWALGSVDYDTLVDRAAKGRTLNKAKLRRVPIPLPPLAEQKRIAGILDAADALRAKRREALAQLDTLTQSLFLDLFGEPLTLQKQGKVVEFGQLTVRITYGFTCPMQHVLEGIPIITAKNVRQGFIDFQNAHCATEEQFESLTDKCKPEEGDLLITKDGAIRGRCAVVPTRSRICISQAVALVRPDRTKVTPEYLWGYIVSDRIQRKIMDMDKGVAMPHLQITELAKFPIFLPSIAMQHEFARRINAVEKLKSTHRVHLAELDTLFASLQSRAFRGEL